MLFHVIVYDMLDITQTNARNDLAESAENVSLELEKFCSRAMNIKFAAHEHMFTDGEHKFTVCEHKINRDMVSNK